MGFATGMEWGLRWGGEWSGRFRQMGSYWAFLIYGVVQSGFGGNSVVNAADVVDWNRNGKAVI